MSLNPLREALGQAGLNAYNNDSTFKVEAEAAVSKFQALRDDLQRQVRQGDLTMKTVRERAALAAEQARNSLLRHAESYSTVPRVFLDRLVEVTDARRKARDRMPVEGLHRETNKLLRLSLVEQQLQNRRVEFEGKAFLRPMVGGEPSPTLDSLLAFHETAQHAGDEAALEWGRRQLEGMRNQIIHPDAQQRVDLACDRPDLVNPRLVAGYMNGVQGSGSNELETFVSQAIEARDANACVAAFVMARQSSEGSRLRWVRQALQGVGEFPDPALATLRAMEAEARAEDARAARSHADFAIEQINNLLRLCGVEPPTEQVIAQQARIQAKPLAAMDEPIGLALDRRGQSQDEYEALWKIDAR